MFQAQKKGNVETLWNKPFKQGDSGIKQGLPTIVFLRADILRIYDPCEPKSLNTCWFINIHRNLEDSLTMFDMGKPGRPATQSASVKRSMWSPQRLICTIIQSPWDADIVPEWDVANTFQCYPMFLCTHRCSSYPLWFAGLRHRITPHVNFFQVWSRCGKWDGEFRKEGGDGRQMGKEDGVRGSVYCTRA